VILLVLLGCYAGMLWWLRRMTQPRPAVRILGRPERQGNRR
jgi:hypothetical protein